MLPRRCYKATSQPGDWLHDLFTSVASRISTDPEDLELLLPDHSCPPQENRWFFNFHVELDPPAPAGARDLKPPSAKRVSTLLPCGSSRSLSVGEAHAWSAPALGRGHPSDAGRQAHLGSDEFFGSTSVTAMTTTTVGSPRPTALLSCRTHGAQLACRFDWFPIICGKVKDRRRLSDERS